MPKGIQIRPNGTFSVLEYEKEDKDAVGFYRRGIGGGLFGIAMKIKCEEITWCWLCDDNGKMRGLKPTMVRPWDKALLVGDLFIVKEGIIDVDDFEEPDILPLEDEEAEKISKALSLMGYPEEVI